MTVIRKQFVMPVTSLASGKIFLCKQRMQVGVHFLYDFGCGRIPFKILVLLNQGFHLFACAAHSDLLV
jgi:hypothetical protein